MSHASDCFSDVLTTSESVPSSSPPGAAVASWYLAIAAFTATVAASQCSVRRGVAWIAHAKASRRARDARSRFRSAAASDTVDVPAFPSTRDLG
eukprot:30992-Pelagococcus_subviridis.AAC.10